MTATTDAQQDMEQMTNLPSRDTRAKTADSSPVFSISLEGGGYYCFVEKSKFLRGHEIGN
jgi:hypothetical protein